MPRPCLRPAKGTLSRPAYLSCYIGSHTSVLTTGLASLLSGWSLFVHAANPAPPNINTNNVFNITNSPYNAVGDGVFTNTTAIQSAINAANAASGGGTVEVPSGVFLCGPLTFKSSVNLQLDAGATLRLLPITQYPGGQSSPANFISGSSLHDIEISGTGGIDGQGGSWWPGYQTNTRPLVVSFSTGTRVLIQDITISNAPVQNISIKGKAGNVMIQRITVLAPDSAAVIPSHNTDAIDLAETNAVIQNCFFSTGDDNVAMGSTASASSDILVTNCLCGYGHGISIGSNTSGGVSNITVINCTFTNTMNGLRIKSDNDRGGLVQNITNLNLSMSNVNFPIQIYAYYNSVGTPNNVTPQQAAANNAAVLSTTPIYRNIIFSNITATTASGYIAGILWPRAELPATNIVFCGVNISASKSFDIYNSTGVQFVDSSVSLPAGTPSYLLYNSQLTITNSTPSATLSTFDGLSTNGFGNSLALYNAQGSLSNTNVFDDGPFVIGASTLSISNDFELFPATVLNFVLGTNPSTISVRSNLALGGTINITAGSGFGIGTNTLLTYAGSLSGDLPTLGSTPAGFVCALNTNTLGSVKLFVNAPRPAAPTNLVAAATNAQVQLSWSTVATANSYKVYRALAGAGPFFVIASGLSTPSYSDQAVTNGTTYYYTVTAVNSGGESPVSNEVNATPTPSLTPVSLVMQSSRNQLVLTWPADHTGWHLQVQTNSLSSGLGTNWTRWAGSDTTNWIAISIDPLNGSVFLRLTYP